MNKPCASVIKYAYGLAALVACITLNSCLLERADYVCVNNNAGYPIAVYVAAGTEQRTAYPDTSLPASDKYVLYNTEGAASVCDYSNYKPWKYFETLPADTLSVFIFNRDTLIAVGWDTVRTRNKVLKRYDLNLADLQSAGWRVTYP